ncbi:GIY-YIG nuclease family protein [bacterium]|nr:MAG: GIY-YIG nuclease family protein [bacterium]
MPFTHQIPRVFTRENIETINPGQFGVYGLLKEGVYVYVGKGDIRKRLLDHLNGDNPCIVRVRPTHWVSEVYADPIMSSREKQLILEYNPLCNQKVG